MPTAKVNGQKMEAAIFLTFIISFSGSVVAVASDQLMTLNFTQLQQVNVVNSTVSEYEDVTICARFLVKHSDENYENVQSEIFTFGPISLKSWFDPRQAFDQILGEVFYRIPTLRNSPRKTFPIWPPGVWNHVCVSFAAKNCGVKVFLNGQTVLDSEMDPCYGFYQSGFSSRLDITMLGLVTDINIWEQVLSREEAKAWTQCETGHEGNLVAWKAFSAKNNDYILAKKVFLDKSDICRRPGKILGFEQIMHFDTILNFCRLLGGRMPTIGDNRTMERINETLMAQPMANLVPKWAFTGYVLDEKQEPVNTYTGNLVCHYINQILVF